MLISANAEKRNVLLKSKSVRLLPALCMQTILKVAVDYISVKRGFARFQWLFRPKGKVIKALLP